MTFFWLKFFLYIYFENLTEMSLRILFQKTWLNSTRWQFDGRHQIYDIGFQDLKRVFTAVAKGELRAFSSLTCL